MTVEEVRNDLKEIQYYYAHEKEFARADRIVGQSNVREKADRYNAAVRTAPPVLYDLYVVKEMLKKLSDKLQLVYFTCHASRAI